MVQLAVDFGGDGDLEKQEDIQRQIKLEEQKLNFALNAELEKNPEDDSRAIAERVVEQLKDGPLEWDVNDLTRAIDAKKQKL